MSNDTDTAAMVEGLRHRAEICVDMRGEEQGEVADLIESLQAERDELKRKLETQSLDDALCDELRKTAEAERDRYAALLDDLIAWYEYHDDDAWPVSPGLGGLFACAQSLRGPRKQGEGE